MDFKEYIEIGKYKSPYFALLNFYIHTPFDIDEIDNVKTESIVDYARFLHEYTHYLQGFCTVYGTLALFKYFSLQHKIEQRIMKEILSGKTIAIELFKIFTVELNKIGTLYFYDLSRDDDKICKNSILKVKQCHPVLKGGNIELFIKLETNYLQHISPKCLRETMAMMAYFNIRGIGQEGANIFFDEHNYDPIYSTLYQYLYRSYPDIHDLIKFTYFFCELALQSEKPSYIVDKIIIKMNKEKGKYSSAEGFFSVFLKENIQIKHNIVKLIKYYTKEKLKLERISSSMEYYRSIVYYIQCCIDGLKYIFQNNTLYKNVMDSRWIGNMVVRLSSPVIITSKDGIKVKTLDNSRDIQELALLFAVGVLLEQYIKYETFDSCPFMEKLPICPLKKERDVQICKKNPYSIKPFDNGGCIFYNANLAIGMLPKEEIDKHRDS